MFLIIIVLNLKLKYKLLYIKLFYYLKNRTYILMDNKNIIKTLSIEALLSIVNALFCSGKL